MSKAISNFRIRIDDYTTYVEGKSRNGGGYSFHEVTYIKNAQIVGGYHSTSAELDYCQYCGSFEQHSSDHIDRWHDDEKYVPSHTVNELLSKLTWLLVDGEESNLSDDKVQATITSEAEKWSTDNRTVKVEWEWDCGAPHCQATITDGEYCQDHK